MMEDMRRRVNRLRWMVLVLILVVVLGATAGAGYLARVNVRQQAQTQLVVACASAKASAIELTALNEIAERLGIPHDFTVPEVLPECAGL